MRNAKIVGDMINVLGPVLPCQRKVIPSLGTQ